jgi:SpoVK/Ycf46/Vps4 family AAA+-type ATPase
MSSLLARMRSKPKQNNDDGQVEAAVAKLKDARRFDDSKQYSTAVMLYEEGLRLLIERHANEVDEPKRAVILKTVEEYMARAERCKQLAQVKKPDHDNYGARPRPPKVPARRPVKRSPQAPRRRSPPPPSEPENIVRDPFEARVLQEMLDGSSAVRWADVAGLEAAKRTLKEAVVLPNLRPDLYRGLRAPPRGVLLFGPPGTGKTFLAKAVATESNAKSFFAASAASLTSKYVGESEKMVRALFRIARERQPSVIFLDEVDSLLSARGDGDQESSRRMKTEFLVQLDGAGTSREDRILFMAATNRPWDLDDALLRRVPRRVLIPLPDATARRVILDGLLDPGDVAQSISSSDRAAIVNATENYSASDLRLLAEDAVQEPLRELGERIASINIKDVRPCKKTDFAKALRVIKPSADASLLERYDEWAQKFGTRGN